MSFRTVHKQCRRGIYNAGLPCLTEEGNAGIRKSLLQLKQDNAGCCHSGYTIVSAKLAGDIAGVVVERNDFSDPQGGKGVCDRQAANIKGDVRIHINEGHDVTTAVELKTAIESSPESCVKASYVSLNTSVTPPVKWEGVSLLNNFKSEESGILAWRAFNVGRGKVISWSQFEGVLQIPEVLEVLDSPSQTKPSFKSVRHRHVKKTSTRDLEATSETTSRFSLLFSCPKEGL